MKRAWFPFALALALSVPALAKETPKPADEVVANACKTAKAQGKNVMVIFHASWCGWCKKMDAFMAMPEFKPVFDASFEVVHITVLESKEKKADENPGGDKLLEKLGGAGGGIPFYAVLDATTGKAIMNSNIEAEGKKPQNIGHPAAPEEVSHFMKMMKASAKKATGEQLVKMEMWLRAQKVG